ncbi:uncharacterized protein ARMOST_01125 [Armillaria ostoyae]|uniref:Uncharacterized protein n=1 Tax=Armillaria ostoyae TaxID=47428 RepID=A0A284QN75_ARMOS|nr:uncharacterized protein ARMOST_01125 [Armillaria ostoyae]
MVLDEDGENGFARPFGLWLPLDRSAVSLTAGYPAKVFMREDTSVYTIVALLGVFNTMGLTLVRHRTFQFFSSSEEFASSFVVEMVESSRSIVYVVKCSVCT